MSQKPKKVPVILQMEALECGAACLCMVLAYHKKWVPLAKVRTDCGVSRDGSNALNIWKAGQNYGMEVKANRYNVEQLKTEATYPAIIWWNYNHFVVLDGFTKNKAVINDPARGIVKVPMPEFKQSYSMLCMQFIPTDKFEPGGRPESVLGFLRKRTKSNGAALLLVGVTGILSVAAGVLMPVFSRVFTDAILMDPESSWLISFIIGYIALILFRAIASGLNAHAILRVTGKLAVTSNVQFMWHILRMPMNFFAQRMAGDLAGRQRANDSVANTLVRQLVPIGMNCALMVIYLVVMVQYSVRLAMVGVGTTMLNVFLARYISQKRLEISRTQMRDQGKLDATTVSGIDMIETIKSSGAENGFFERWSGYHASVNRSKTEFAEVNRFLDPIAGLLQSLSNVLVLSIGVWLIMQKQFTVGMLIAFQGFMSAFLNPVNQVIGAGQSIQEMRASMERIDDVMNYPAEVPETVDPAEGKGMEDVQKLSGEISIDHVTFGYARLSPPLITDFSLKLKPGSRVALVGGSGSGKSTIAKLISGLYQPWEGEIRFDGKLISEIPRAIFTGSVSVVDQDVVLLEDTILNNIRMWDETIEEYEVVLAARDAGVHSAILGKRGGYHHMLREGGKDLSGGQRQRLDIARVLAGDPSVIVMDEATSALDAKTEYEVSEAIRARGVTCVIVAHRLSTIRDCDEIIVLDRGKVVERGTHEELLKNDGLYRKLVVTE